MMNLVVNARDAMPDGGTLRIETANVELGAGQRRRHSRAARRADRSSDSGLGMTAEVRERLFEPFFTTKDDGHGTGLGLSMVQAIVRQSGGHIIVDSAAKRTGRRSRFTFRGKADSRRRAGACRPAVSQRPSSRAKASVLLAEDDRSVRRLVVAELTRRGFTVLEAEDGAAALEMFRNES